MTSCVMHPANGLSMEFATSLAPAAHSAREARRFVMTALAGRGLDSESAELVVAELMANVVQHAETEVEVKLFIGATVRLEVHDGNALIPAMRDAAEDAESGRGLFIIDALSRSWGIEKTDTGKCIWVDLERAPMGQMSSST